MQRRFREPGAPYIYKSLKLNGSNKCVKMSTAALAASTSAPGFSISAWVYPLSFAAEGYIYSTSVRNGTGIRIGFSITNTGAIRVQARSQDGDLLISFLSAETLKIGRWYHLVMTLDCAGDIGFFYFDGVRKTTGAAMTFSTSAFQSNDSKFAAIGANPDGTGTFLNAMINSVALYRRALTLGEVQELYNLGLPGDVKGALGSPASPTAWWKLGQGDTTATALEQVNGSTWNGVMTNIVSTDLVTDSPGSYNLDAG